MQPSLCLHGSPTQHNVQGLMINLAGCFQPGSRRNERRFADATDHIGRWEALHGDPDPANRATSPYRRLRQSVRPE
jgi:hypothetical protein